MGKTPLQIFEEQEQKECCLNCLKLIVKQTDKGHINFCGYCGKIILDMFLDCGNLRDCEYEKKGCEQIELSKHQAGKSHRTEEQREVIKG